MSKYNILIRLNTLYCNFIVTNNTERLAKKTLSAQEKSPSKDFPLDGKNYTLIEYPDIIFEKNKKIRIKGLGEKFALSNSFFLEYLNEYYIPTAFLKHHSNNILKFIAHQRYPFYVKMLNIADKRMKKIFGKKEFEPLDLSVFEFHYGEGKDSLFSESHLISFDFCNYEDLKLISRMCSKINAVLRSFFERRNEILAEVNCFFGKTEDKIYLVEDFTPKSIKLLSNERNEKSINPYKLDTPAHHRKYIDHLFNLMST